MNRRLAPPRLDWVDRQLLEGSALNDALEFLDARRGRHLRGAHRTVGVALGLAVSSDLKSTPRTAVVGPGLAYDAMGRELLVLHERSVAIPEEASGTLIVTITSGGCIPDAEVGLIAGQRPVPPRTHISIATIDLATGTIGTSRRPHVRTMAPPVVASGHVEVGSSGAQGSTFAYNVTVDTTSAGFETTPLYLAAPSFSRGFTAFAGILLGPMLDVHDAATNRFSLGVRYVAPSVVAAAFANVLNRPVTTNQFAFDWIGFVPHRTFGVETSATTANPVI